MILYIKIHRASGIAFTRRRGIGKISNCLFDLDVHLFVL